MGMVIKHGGRRRRVCSGDGDLPGWPGRYRGGGPPFPSSTCSLLTLLTSGLSYK